jgi:predicted ribonuclease YlaK
VDDPSGSSPEASAKKSKALEELLQGVRKTFVLDTNVLLHDPRAMFSFEDNDVVIPIYVVEEIDSFKKDLSELGRNARQVSRYLDGLREEGSLKDGVDLDRGGLLRVATTHRSLPQEVATDRGQDGRILAVALELHEDLTREKVVFITKDTNLRIRADAIGIQTEDYEPERIEASDLEGETLDFEHVGVVGRGLEVRLEPCELGATREIGRDVSQIRQFEVQTEALGAESRRIG